MITLMNPKGCPVKIKYNNGATKVFNAEVIPGYIMAFRGLQTSSQIVNLQALINEGITIYNYNAGTYINKGSFATLYYGTTGATGMTFTVDTGTVSTGYTFVTSANTVMVNNTISATTVGNTINVGFSGSAVSTLAWYNAIEATAFSGMGVTVIGENSGTFITSSGTKTFTLTASTTSGFMTSGPAARAEMGTFMFADTNTKASNYITFGASSFAAGLTQLNGLI